MMGVIAGLACGGAALIESRPPEATTSRQREERPQPAALRRDNLDAYVEQLTDAAQRGDTRLLADAIVVPEVSPSGVVQDRAARLAAWREHPEILENVGRMFLGPCVFVDQKDRMVCSPSLGPSVAEHEAVGASFKRYCDGWAWTGLVDFVGRPLASDSGGPPSKSALVTTKTLFGDRVPNAKPRAESAAPKKSSDVATSHHIAAASSPTASCTEGVRTVIRSNIEDVRGCYKKALASDPTLASRVTLQFTIGRDGTALSGAANDSHLPDPVLDCVADAAAAWTFPEFGGRENLIVRYPVVLELD